MKEKQLNSSIKAYLLAYNVFQFLGWNIILIQTLNHLVYEREVEGLWGATNVCLKIFQTLAFLEVLHVLLGIVRSGVITTTIQILSRVVIVWFICNNFKASQERHGLVVILIAWSITEIIRYSFYFLNLLQRVPYFIVYLRYTLFIVLYPMGVIGEQWCTISAMPEIATKGSFSIAMPNRFNFTFDFYLFCIVLLLLYIPFFPQLYLHMFAQRKKALSSGDKKKD